MKPSTAKTLDKILFRLLGVAIAAGLFIYGSMALSAFFRNALDIF